MKTKTKLGLSVGLLATLTCLMALFGGYIGLLIVVGYILICEKDSWLRSIALGVLLLNLAVSLLGAVLGIIPEIVNFFTDVMDLLLGSGHYIALVNNSVNVFMDFIGFLQKVFLIVLSLLFLFGVQFRISFLETLVGKLPSRSDED